MPAQPHPTLLHPVALPATPPGAAGGCQALRHALAGSGGRIAAVSFSGPDAAVPPGLVAGIPPGIPMPFLETGQHAPETLDDRRQLAGMLGLRDVCD